MKATPLMRCMVLAASLLLSTACADRIVADGTAETRAEPMAEIALDHDEDAGPVLSVAPPQRRKARPAMHRQPEQAESLASGLSGESY